MARALPRCHRWFSARRSTPESRRALAHRRLAEAAHDLRQPLMALSMFVLVLEANNRDSALTPLIDKIKSSANEIGGLVAAMLAAPGAAPAPPIAAPIAEAKEALPQAQHAALIVVVDDEELVRDSLVAVLECWGYRVVAAGGDHEVLEVLAQQGEIPDLLIADFRLRSGRNGIDLVTYLRRELNESFPALLLTGDTTDVRLHQAKADGILLLSKPLDSKQLRQTVIDLLAKGRDDTLDER